MFGKKKSKLFGNEIEIKCEYCKNSADYDGASVCRLSRYRNPDGSCRHFNYDPLKRNPENLPSLKSHDAEEFQL